MKLNLAYGKSGLWVDVPESAVVLRPKGLPKLANLNEQIRQHLERPTRGAPLAAQVSPGMRVVVLHTDITRATPNQQLLPPLLAYLEQHGVERNDINLINALGTHEAQTPLEMRMLLGEEILSRYTCLQHDSQGDEMETIGVSCTGNPLEINRQVVEADLRILTGFIEPHFFAGFSGGPKAILPGTASTGAIQRNHSSKMIAHPKATFGNTWGNPLWEEMAEAVSCMGPSFLLNVSLNTLGEVTGLFTGEVFGAHQAGCDFVRKNAMAGVDAPFDVVVTTNSGYPLDQNLYQSVKGLSAAEQIVRKGGAILLASRCEKGLPDGGGYARFLRDAGTLSTALEQLQDPTFSMLDQWQVQVQARIQQQAKVFVFSEGLTDGEIRQAWMQPCQDIEIELRYLMKKFGPRVCILPEGPLTIPYLRDT
jgi:nickel-dependent lactate racemase